MVASWAAEPIAYAMENPVTGGLYRVSGDALLGGDRVGWTLVAKQLRRHADGTNPALAPSDVPHHWNYWRREALAYASPLAGTLPAGLAMPAGLAVDQPNADEAWVYLEAIAGEPAADWTLERFGLAARHLGRWQGRFAARRQGFAAAWMCRGWLRAWNEPPSDTLLALVEDADAWRHPWLEGLLADARGAVTRVVAGRERLLDALEHAPRTICHLDCWSPNLISRPAPGETETVLLDWSMVGDGTPGEDPANLVFDTVWSGKRPVAELDELEARVWAGYAAGLREGGYADERAARFGFAAAAGVRFGVWTLQVLRLVRDRSRQAAAEARFGLPIEAVVAARARVAVRALALAEEAMASVPGR